MAQPPLPEDVLASALGAAFVIDRHAASPASPSMAVCAPSTVTEEANL